MKKIACIIIALIVLMIVSLASAEEVECQMQWGELTQKYADQLSPEERNTHAVLMAEARSSMSNTRCNSSGLNPAAISCNMACGSSSRGLSDVSINCVLKSYAMRAMIGRLPLSRLPPQPTTVITCADVVCFLAATISLMVFSTFSTASGVCA